MKGAYSTLQTLKLLFTPFVPSRHSGCLSCFAPLFEQMPFKFSDIFFFAGLISVFKTTVSPTLMQIPPALIHQPLFLGLNKYQKGEFTSSTVAFYQKSILIF